MNATTLPAATPSTTRQRAAEIIRAWTAWRTARLTRPKLDTVVDGTMLATLIGTWAIGYVLLCPSEPPRHAFRPTVAAASTFMVLR